MTRGESDAAVRQLHEDLAKVGLLPLWRQRGSLMPTVPEPMAVPHLWPWAEVPPFVLSDAPVYEALKLFRTETSTRHNRRPS